MKNAVKLSDYRAYLASIGQQNGDKDLIKFAKTATVSQIKRRWLSQYFA